MEITNKNFKEKFNEVIEAIGEASFLTIDTEFTGLSSPHNAISPYDTPEDRYHKLSKGATDYLVVQFGLGAFQYDKEKESYNCRCYNFYTFPRPFSRQAPDVRFLCQSSSIDFLVTQGFDFNKVFREGIPYLRPAEEQQLVTSLEDKYSAVDASQARTFSSPMFTSPAGDHYAPPTKGPVHVPEEHKEFIEATCQKVEDFLQNSTENSLALPPCNGYLRKLIYQNVGIRFPARVHLEARTDEKKMRYICVNKVSSEKDMKDREETKRAGEYQEVQDAAGFARVIRKISESGKLVVGHNMILDILHTIHHFVCPLPASYEEFKSMASCIFPKILDTKVMGTTHPIKECLYNTALGEMHKVLSHKPFPQPTIVFPEDFPSYSTLTEKLHEAGYDAYITGCCFVIMANFLGTFQKPVQTYVPPNSSLLEPFVNKLHLMRIQDIPYMNLSGMDLVPSREHVFYISFPAEWKASDLSMLFSPFGNIQISWLDDTSAYVGLYKKDNADQVMKKLYGAESYSVVRWQDHAHSQKRDGTPLRKAIKRSAVMADVDMPAKKRKSGSFGSPHPLTSIPEADEEENREAAKNNGPNGNSEKDLGLPVKRSRLSADGAESDPGGAAKMFVETESW